MNAHILAGILAGFLGGGAAFGANFVCLLMINKINARVAEHEKIPQYWWNLWDVAKRFKQMFPEDGLSVWLKLCITTIAVAFVFGVRFWVFG